MVSHFLENAKDTLCRNVTIYGRCRYEDKGTANRFLFPLHIIDYELDLTAHPKGCAFNHDPQKMNPANNSDRLGYSYSWKTQHLCAWNGQWLICDFQFSRKRFNVDSPSFTPSLLSANGSTATTPTKKTATISPKAANAAPFQPRGVSSRMVFSLMLKPGPFTD